jgi:hypothetical protein
MTTIFTGRFGKSFVWPGASGAIAISAKATIHERVIFPS